MQRTEAQQSVSRRKFSRLAFLGLLGAGAVGGVAAIAQFLNPARPSRLMFVGKLADFVPDGPPIRFQMPESGAAAPQAAGHNVTFWVARLTGTDTRANGDGGQAGVVALAGYCTHLGCTIPWRPEFKFGSEQGWFRCGCHGATFTRAGDRVYGPAPRGLDAHPVQIRNDGTVYVDRGRVLPGNDDGPSPMTPIPLELG
jgi:Rieske Fe-S protein